MTIRKLKHRLAAAALAATLAVTGVVGVGAAVSTDRNDVGQEQAGGTWSRVAPEDPRGGGYHTNGGTWS
ncbi:MAG: hypothetical protein ACFCVK_01290 [Acidimicrobiales bacterium]